MIWTNHIEDNPNMESKNEICDYSINKTTMSCLMSRIKNKSMKNLVMSPQDVIPFFKNGQTLGWSGFTPAGYPKAIPIALANHVRDQNLQGKLKFNLRCGASVGSETADVWATLGMIQSYYPYQTGKNISKEINQGNIEFIDFHLSNFANYISNGHLKSKIDIAIIEATEITENGEIVLGASGGVSQELCRNAEKIIIEINTSIPSYFGLHDIVEDFKAPNRSPFLIQNVSDRIGSPSMRIDVSKVIGIVESQHSDNGRPLAPSDETSARIAEHIIAFFHEEVSMQRLPKNLLPLQSGVGNIANAVISGLANSQFENLTMWTEVLQDKILDWFDTGKLKFASTTALSLSVPGFQRFYNNWDQYVSKIVIRPQSISNHPETIRRLGVLSMNTPIEIDLYSHTNSTHVLGSRVINGIGGSGDFIRNSFLSIVHTPSTRATPSDKTGISSIVPFCSHVDHTEHDVMIVVTEQGLADCRNLDPISRARMIIAKCVHPDYKDQLNEYLNMAISECRIKGMIHQPHVLSKAFRMYENLSKNGTMKLNSWN